MDMANLIQFEKLGYEVPCSLRMVTSDMLIILEYVAIHLIAIFVSWVVIYCYANGVNKVLEKISLNKRIVILTITIPIIIAIIGLSSIIYIAEPLSKSTKEYFKKRNEQGNFVNMQSFKDDYVEVNLYKVDKSIYTNSAIKECFGIIKELDNENYLVTLNDKCSEVKEILSKREGNKWSNYITNQEREKNNAE